MKNIILLLCVIVLAIFSHASKIYASAEKSIDLVIPVAYKDRHILKKSLEGILANSLTPISKIYIISQNKEILSDLNFQGKIIFISEDMFPFSKKDVEDFLHKKHSKFHNASWYYQQLLKFYAFKVIKDLSDDFLILDSDFIFKNKLKFLTKEGKAILAFGYPITNDYCAQFSRKLIPDWKLISSFTGIHHHMIFQQFILKDLFERVESFHHKEFWKAFLDTIDINQWHGASEYMIYFHFATKNYPHDIHVRHLHAFDIIHNAKDQDDKDILAIFDELSKDLFVQAIGSHMMPNLKENLESKNYKPTPNTAAQKKPFCFIYTTTSEGFKGMLCSEFMKKKEISNA